MRTTSTGALRRSLNSASGVVSRSGCIALFACMGAGLIASLGACGGGGDVGVSPSSTAATRCSHARSCGRSDTVGDCGGAGHWGVGRHRRERRSRHAARGAQRQRRLLRGVAGVRRHAPQPLGQPLSGGHGCLGQRGQHRDDRRRHRQLRSLGRSRRQRRGGMGRDPASGDERTFSASAGVWAAAVLRAQQGLPRPRVASDASGAVIVV